MAKSGKQSSSSWKFSVSVLLPVLVAVLVAVGTASSFVVWSTTRSDDSARARQSRLVSHILGKEREYLSDYQSDISPWDDVIDAIEGGIDIEWVSENLGADFYENYATHRIYLLDPDMRPRFAMRDGGNAAVSSFAGDSETILKLARKLRTDESLSAISAFENGFGTVPAVSDFAVIEGRPALVGVIPLLGESEDVKVPPGKAFTHVAIRFLDDALAKELMDAYLIEGAHFSTDGTLGAGEDALPLLDADGNTVAWFKWLPDRPGAQILSETAPAMVGALLAGGLVVLLLLLRLRMSSNDLEAARAEAHHRALHDPLTGLANRAGFQERL
ncbi:MAG: CHASE4 domain-containing protein, partial [Allorhizobium sp.]